MTVFEVNTSGWVQQNAGREPWELFREALQNALDTQANIRVEISTRGRTVAIEDEGPGFEELSDIWTIFGGDKADDPTKRGRFGRGLKELVAGTESLTVETTVGSVTFSINRAEDKYEKEVDEDKCREVGTRIVAENSTWSTGDMQDMREYIDKLWVPEGQELTIDVSGGKTKVKKHGDPSYVFDMRLDTTSVESGVMKQYERNTEVHVRYAGGAGNKGKIYEMGIPVELDWEAPYEVDIQQRIPMAEQRNEVDQGWLRDFEPKFLNEIFPHLPDSQMDAEWVQSNIDSWRINSEVKEQYIEKVFNGDGAKGVVMSDDPSMDDKAQNHGYKVVDTEGMGYSMKKMLRSHTESSSDVALRIMQREEKQVTPTPDQENFVIEVMRLLDDVSRLNTENISVEFWKLAPTDQMETNSADFNDNTQTIRLNVEAHDWDEINAQTLGTFVHEVAHMKGSGHDVQWYSELERIFAELLVQRL